MPISPNCDRDNADGSQIALCFIDFIVAPQFSCVSRVLPKVQICLNILKENRKKWHQQVMEKIAKVEDKQKREAQFIQWRERQKAFEDKYKKQ